MNQAETQIQPGTLNDVADAETARLTDLTISEVQSDEIKGGMLLPAVQKVREAAARIQTTGSSGMSAGKVSNSDLS